MALSPLYQQILAELPNLPDTAKIPLPVVEVLEGTCRRTIQETYPLVQLNGRRKGVLLGYLRRKAEPVAKAPAARKSRKRNSAGRFSTGEPVTA